MNSAYIYCSKINKKALYFLEQSIFEKAKIHPRILTLSSLLGVTDLGLGRLWPGSRWREKEEFEAGWVSGEMMMWVPGGRNTGWDLKRSPFLSPADLTVYFPKTFFLHSSRPTIRKVPGFIFLPSFFTPEFCKGYSTISSEKAEGNKFWRWCCKWGMDS